MSDQEKAPRSNRARSSQLGFQYLTDELGHIIGTRDPGSMDDQGTASGNPLGPFNKPRMTKEVMDNPQKKALWDAYWDAQRSWWEDVRMQERRDRW